MINLFFPFVSAIYRFTRPFLFPSFCFSFSLSLEIQKENRFCNYRIQILCFFLFHWNDPTVFSLNTRPFLHSFLSFSICLSSVTHSHAYIRKYHIIFIVFSSFSNRLIEIIDEIHHRIRTKLIRILQ